MAWVALEQPQIDSLFTIPLAGNSSFLLSMVAVLGVHVRAIWHLEIKSFQG